MLLCVQDYSTCSKIWIVVIHGCFSNEVPRRKTTPNPTTKPLVSVDAILCLPVKSWVTKANKGDCRIPCIWILGTGFSTSVIVLPLWKSYSLEPLLCDSMRNWSWSKTRERTKKCYCSWYIWYSKQPLKLTYLKLVALFTGRIYFKTIQISWAGVLSTHVKQPNNLVVRLRSEHRRNYAPSGFQELPYSQLALSSSSGKVRLVLLAHCVILKGKLACWNGLQDFS